MQLNRPSSFYRSAGALIKTCEECPNTEVSVSVPTKLLLQQLCCRTAAKQLNSFAPASPQPHLYTIYYMVTALPRKNQKHLQGNQTTDKESYMWHLWKMMTNWRRKVFFQREATLCVCCSHDWSSRSPLISEYPVNVCSIVLTVPYMTRTCSFFDFIL